MLLGDDMRIGALGKAAGIDPETIRYYERMGLLPAPERQANGYRAYGAAHLEQLACQPMTIPSWFVRGVMLAIFGLRFAPPFFAAEYIRNGNAKMG